MANERVYNNVDELQAAIEADELADRLELASQQEPGVPPKMSVREYAKAHKMQPQLLYYYIRRGYIKEESCPCCGRKVIDIASADEYLNKKATSDPRRPQSLEE